MASAFQRIMQKGHAKTHFTQRQGKLLLTFSDEDHKKIAKLIVKWLEETSESTQQTPKPSK